MAREVFWITRLAVAWLITWPGAVGSWTYHVKPDGSGDLPTIEAAVADAEDGDIIELAAGTYRGPGNRDVNLLGKSITVRSQDGDAQGCVIDCQGSGEEPHRAFLVVSGEGPDCVLEGFTISGGHVSNMGGAIDCCNGAATLRNLVFAGNQSGWNGGAVSGGSPTLIDCVFSGNTAEQGGALACAFGGSITCTGCVFLDNTATLHGGAIRISDPSQLALTDCTFSRNQNGTFGGALATSTTNTLRISGCTFYANQSTGAVIFAWSGALEVENTLIVFSPHGSAFDMLDATATLACCDLYGNGGDWIGPIAGQLGESGNISADPQFCTEVPHEDGNWGLQSDSPCTEPQSGCGTIGAWAVHCDDTPARSLSWGALKAAFRE